MNSKKVIVVGATGNLGSKIVKALIEQGSHVTAMVRATSKRSMLQELGVKNFVVGDLMNPASLKEALSQKPGFDAIVASAAGYTGHSKGDTSKTDTIGYYNLVDAAKQAGIQRFVLISILESDKAVKVPHFYNKYLVEKYLKEKKQPYIALRPGAFFDWSEDFMLKKINKGIVPVFFHNVNYGTIYTPDLARYAAIAATTLPNSELNTHVDVGWSTPVNSKTLEEAFKKVLNRPFKTKPVIPPFVLKAIAPLFAAVNGKMKDMYEMIKWVNSGVYVSSDTTKQKKLFKDLPTIEEAIRRYCKDRKLI